MTADRPDARVLRRLSLVALPLVAVPGLVVELLHHLAPDPGPDHAIDPWVEVFSLSYEANVPTWYATVLLFTCALLLAGHAAGASRRRAHWWGLAAALAYVSLDEAVQLHEHLNGLLPTGGVLYFDWIIPAGAVVLVLLAAYVPFLRDLPAATRRRFLVAGTVYVGGALLFELPLGWWAERAGEENLGYVMIDFAEELLELGGATLFLHALLDHREP